MGSVGSTTLAREFLRRVTRLLCGVRAGDFLSFLARGLGQLMSNSSLVTLSTKLVKDLLARDLGELNFQVPQFIVEYEFCESQFQKPRFNFQDLIFWKPKFLGPKILNTSRYLDFRYLNSLLGERRRGRGQRGLILLDHHWQENIGDFTFSRSLKKKTNTKTKDFRV